jgi:hypothetical protein
MGPAEHVLRTKLGYHALKNFFLHIFGCRLQEHHMAGMPEINVFIGN